MASSSSFSPSSSAIPFIQETAVGSGEFIVTTEAKKILSNIKGKFCPLIVAGPYRSGKSTLLNLLLSLAANNSTSSASPRQQPVSRNNVVFAVGGSTVACTKGIWLWGHPIVSNDGKTYLFLDSEGLGSVGSQNTFDVKIFTLSLLLSSVFILNTTGAISERSIEELDLVVQMSARIRTNNSNPNSKMNGTTQSVSESLSSLSAHFPSFLWVLRDFSLSLEDSEGRNLTPTSYLEQALQTNSKSSEKNRIRQAITTAFPRRDCSTLIRPVVEEKDLRKVSQLNLRDLRNEFVVQLQELLNKIQSMAQPKQMEGVSINGSLYVSLAEDYVGSINSGQILTIRSAWENVVELAARTALDQAQQEFQQFFQQNYQEKQILSTQEFQQLLSKAQNHSIQLLHTLAVGDSSQMSALDSEFELRLQRFIDSQREINERRSETDCPIILSRLWKDNAMDEKLKSLDFTKDSDVQEYQSKLNQIHRLYQSQARGPHKEIVLNKFMLERTEDVMRQMVTIMRNEKKENASTISNLTTQLKEEKSNHQLSREQARKYENEGTKLSTELFGEKQRYETEKQQWQAKITSLEQKLKEEKKNKEVSIEDKKQVELHVRELETEKSQLTNQLAVQTRKSQTFESRVSELETEKSQLTNQTRKSQTLESELKYANNEIAQQRKSLQSESQQREALLKERDNFHQQINDLREKERQEREKSNESNARHDLEIKNARQQESDLKQQLSNLQKQIEQYSKEIEGLKTNLKASSGEKSKKRKSLHSTEDIDMEDDDHDYQDHQLNDQSFNHEEEQEEKRQTEIKMPPQHKISTPQVKTSFDISSSSNSSRPSASSSSSSFSSRRSLGPRSSIGGELVDPNPMTIQQLKSWLTELDVEFPMKAQPKKFYINLIYNAIPELEEQFPKK